MDRRHDLLRLRNDLERQIAEADELASLGLEAAGEGSVSSDELLRVKKQQRQLRVLLADCERQLQSEG